jgi:hypothetical protein
MKTAKEWSDWAWRQVEGRRDQDDVVIDILAEKCAELEQQNSGLLEVIDNLASRIVLHTKELKELKTTQTTE